MKPKNGTRWLRLTDGNPFRAEWLNFAPELVVVLLVVLSGIALKLVNG
jgi:hypothetical protein